MFYVSTSFLFLFLSVVALIALDNWQYPMCPKCKDNLKSKRSNFFSNAATCRLHGDFKTD